MKPFQYKLGSPDAMRQERHDTDPRLEDEASQAEHEKDLEYESRVDYESWQYDEREDE
jgi:hypothetical protein